jgi:hypothetical protein
MTNPTINSVCPQCGSAIELRHEGSTQGLFCTNCEWSVVTTVLPDILRDTSSYTVKVTQGDFKNDHHLKVVAQLAGVNMLASRRMLQQSESFVVATGSARKIAAARDALLSAGLGIAIEPPFPW